MIEVSKLTDGDWCVDLGRKWYRVRRNGEVIVREGTSRPRRGGYAFVNTRRPTPREISFATAKVREAKALEE